MNATFADPTQQLSLKNIAILVVDDEEDIRDIVKVMLEAYGAQVTLATCGEEGLLLSKNKRFDAILSDLTMPHGDGLFFLSELRKRDLDHPPFILFTANIPYPENYYFHLGVKTIIHKPFDFNDLASALLELIQ